jgi:hypothetical protein
MITANSAFRHVRSLDLGVTSKGSNPKDCLEEQLTILEIFAQRQTLTRLWLSRVPFPSIESSRRVPIRDLVAALSSSISDLGLYECQFASHVDLISFIRAFPHCDSLYVRDCVADEKGSSENVFSGFPEHNLSLEALELTSSSSNGRIIDVSSLIEDAGLGVSQLSTLVCNFASTEQARSVATITSASPIQHFHLACREPGGFQGTCETTASDSTLTLFFVSLSSVPQPSAKEVDSGVFELRTNVPQDGQRLLGGCIPGFLDCSSSEDTYPHVLLFKLWRIQQEPRGLPR